VRPDPIQWLETSLLNACASGSCPATNGSDVLSSSLLLTNLSSGTLKVKFHPFLGLGQADTVIVTGATNNIGLPFVHGGGLIVVRANMIFSPHLFTTLHSFLHEGVLNKLLDTRART
jgi:hypothetical protein